MNLFEFGLCGFNNALRQFRYFCGFNIGSIA
jgi:hypothetical protein